MLRNSRYKGAALTRLFLVLFLLCKVRNRLVILRRLIADDEIVKTLLALILLSRSFLLSGSRGISLLRFGNSLLLRFLFGKIGNRFDLVKYGNLGHRAFLRRVGSSFRKDHVLIFLGSDVFLLFLSEDFRRRQSVDNFKLILADGMEEHLENKGTRIQRKHNEFCRVQRRNIAGALLNTREIGIESVGNQQTDRGQTVDETALDRISALDSRRDHRVGEIVKRGENVAEKRG